MIVTVTPVTMRYSMVQCDRPNMIVVICITQFLSEVLQGNYLPFHNINCQHNNNYINSFRMLQNIYTVFALHVFFPNHSLIHPVDCNIYLTIIIVAIHERCTTIYHSSFMSIFVTELIYSYVNKYILQMLGSYVCILHHVTAI